MTSCYPPKTPLGERGHAISPLCLFGGVGPIGTNTKIAFAEGGSQFGFVEKSSGDPTRPTGVTKFRSPGGPLAGSRACGCLRDILNNGLSSVFLIQFFVLSRALGFLSPTHEISTEAKRREHSMGGFQVHFSAGGWSL